MGNTTQRARQVITLIVTCLGFFMVLLDSSIVVVALPTIQADLHAQLSDLQWTVDAYTLPFAALMLTTGTLGDRFGRKRVFLVGLILFLIGSIFCGFASTLGWLIFGRAVQGVGAAALSPGSLSLLAAAFPEPRARAQAIGVWSGISGVALAAGPLVGGLLIHVSSWPAIFFVNLPIGLVTLALGWPLLAESRNPTAQRLDWPGQVLVIGALTCLIMALIQSSSLGWSSPLILGLLVGFVVLLAAFLLVETQMREPLLPLRLFANRVFSVANLAGLFLSFVILGTVFFLAQYFQQVQGSTALDAGLQILPITVSTFVVSPFAGRLTARLGPRLPIVLGAVLASGGLFLLMLLEPQSLYATLWWKLAMLGIGIGLMFSPLTVVVLSVTPAARTGLGSSVLNTFRQVGATLGVAVLGVFVLQQFSGNIVSQLVHRGVSGSTSAIIASKIASAGAQASRVPLSGRLPLSQAALHQAISQAFVDALHGSFLISGVGLLVAALLVGLLIEQKQRVESKSKESADVAVATGAQMLQANPQIEQVGTQIVEQLAKNNYITVREREMAHHPGRSPMTPNHAVSLPQEMQMSAEVAQSEYALTTEQDRQRDAYEERSKELQEQIAANEELLRAHAAWVDALTRRCSRAYAELAKGRQELQEQIAADEELLRVHEARIDALTKARVQVHAELGKLLRIQADQQLAAHEATVRSLAKRLAEAQVAYHELHKTYDAKLAEWPEYRRDLREKHRTRQDTDSQMRPNGNNSSNAVMLDITEKL